MLTQTWEFIMSPDSVQEAEERLGFVRLNLVSSSLACGCRMARSSVAFAGEFMEKEFIRI